MSRKEQLDAVRKGVQNINRAKEEPVDANAVIIGNFLQGYIAVDEYGPGGTVMTTDEIISALSDMADLEQAAVNQVLATIGYKPGRNEAGSFGWLMKHIDI